jgi:hypothetical protein
VRGGGDALRMAAGPFRIEFGRNPALHGSAISLHVRTDGTNLADRSVQPGGRLASRCSTAPAPIISRDTRFPIRNGSRRGSKSPRPPVPRCRLSGVRAAFRWQQWVGRTGRKRRRSPCHPIYAGV